MMTDHIELWHDRQLLGGMDVLRANCRSYRYGAHAHDCFVIAAFSEGAQKHRIGGAQGVALPGTVMVIPPGETHTGESAVRNGGWSYSAFYPSAASLDQLSETLFGHSRGSLDFGTTFLIEDRELATKLLSAADATYGLNDHLKRQDVVYDAFDLLIRRYGRRSGAQLSALTAMAPIQAAVDYIMANLNDKLTIAKIAAEVGLSEFHFMRLFKQRMNMTVYQFVTHRRLEKAKVLLTKGTSAAHVAASLGFYDQSHFTGHFRRAFGLTPNRYARACR